MKRTQNAIRNIASGFINKVIILLFPFLIKTVIIQVLGANYLGLNGLFTSLLQVLNLAELGFSSAVIYSMYKPIAEKDKTKICALMNLYKKIYRYVGIIITICGLALLPFLKYFVSGDYPTDINLYLLYLLYLLNTSLTYFLFSYKSALLSAYQRNDIINNIQTVTSLFQYLLQILVLVVTKNYYLFAIIQILITICNNIILSIITDKKYKDYKCSGDVDSTTKREIKKSVTGLMIHKLCATTRNSFDSIFISAFLGLEMVAIYSNYYSIIFSLIGLMGIITTSLVAGIGNSIVTETESKNYQDMRNLNFIYMWLSGWATVCLACLYQPFMKLWMGDKYMFPYGVVILFCIYFYSLKMGDIRAMYSDAKGLWFENRYRAIAESIVNLILNLVLVHFFGIYGIITGTLISLLIINFGYGSQILFKHYFIHQKVSEYFSSHGLYMLVTLVISIITYYICSFVEGTKITDFILKLVICIMIPNIMYYLVYFKTKIFKESTSIVKRIVYRRGENL